MRKVLFLLLFVVCNVSVFSQESFKAPSELASGKVIKMKLIDGFPEKGKRSLEQITRLGEIRELVFKGDTLFYMNDTLFLRPNSYYGNNKDIYIYTTYADVTTTHTLMVLITKDLKRANTFYWPLPVKGRNAMIHVLTSDLSTPLVNGGLY